MRRTTRLVLFFAAAFVLRPGALLETSSAARAADNPAEPKLLPADPAAIAAREKALAEKAPKGAKLVAYLDCGAQRESQGAGKVKITWVPGMVHQFLSETKGVPPAQATIFFGESEVVFKIAGLDGDRRYMAGLTWWDYDNGGRTQSVLLSSPDGRSVRLAVPAIRLPNYIADKQLPAERRFALPVVFAEAGRLQLTVQLVTGPNAVISELWIWQLN